ncbi:MAG: hypothetical protein HY897_20565 [Deltaproteobacteria bacterium]|nr:hypothetical protein [Deltaproteobacteria bacterium]
MSDDGGTNIEPRLDEAGASTADLANRKRRILVALVLYAAFLGVVGILMGFLPKDARSPNMISAIAVLPALILAILWCDADARHRGHKIGSVARLGLVFCFVVAFPVYVFRSRGLSGFKTLGLAMLFIAAMIGCAFVAGLMFALVAHFAGFKLPSPPR